MLAIKTKELLRRLSSPWPDAAPAICPSSSAWFHAAHRRVFTQLLRKKSQGLYLEVGAWTGSGSTKFVVDNFPNMDLICIDTFEGNVEHKRKEVWSKIAANLWDHFCGNHWDNRERIYPMRLDSVTAIQQLAANGIAPDFVYIDGAHDEHSVYADVAAAIQAFPGAVIIGDDYVLPGHGHTGVWKGLDRALHNNLFQAIEFKTDKRVWWLDRNVHNLKG